MARPNAPSKVGKVKVQISDKWREEDIVAEDKRMNKLIVHRGKSNITFVPLMQLKAKKKIFFLSPITPDCPCSQSYGFSRVMYDVRVGP